MPTYGVAGPVRISSGPTFATYLRRNSIRLPYVPNHASTNTNVCNFACMASKSYCIPIWISGSSEKTLPSISKILDCLLRVWEPSLLHTSWHFRWKLRFGSLSNHLSGACSFTVPPFLPTESSRINSVLAPNFCSAYNTSYSVLCLFLRLPTTTKTPPAEVSASQMKDADFPLDKLYNDKISPSLISVNIVDLNSTFCLLSNYLKLTSGDQFAVFRKFELKFKRFYFLFIFHNIYFSRYKVEGIYIWWKFPQHSLL
jgi:hypothetical protein